MTRGEDELAANKLRTTVFSIVIRRIQNPPLLLLFCTMIQFYFPRCPCLSESRGVFGNWRWQSICPGWSPDGESGLSDACYLLIIAAWQATDGQRKRGGPAVTGPSERQLLQTTRECFDWFWAADVNIILGIPPLFLNSSRWSSPKRQDSTSNRHTACRKYWVNLRKTEANQCIFSFFYAKIFKIESPELYR